MATGYPVTDKLLHLRVRKELAPSTIDYMNKKKSLLAILLFISLYYVQAQDHKATWFMMQLYKDSSLQTPDTASHLIKLYTANGEEAFVMQEEYIFRKKDNQPLPALLLKIDNRQLKLKLTTREWNGRFVVLKAYLSSSATATDVDFTFKHGDVIYVLNKCNKNCSKVQILHPAPVMNANGKLTTGYPALDKYLFQ